MCLPIRSLLATTILLGVSACATPTASTTDGQFITDTTAAPVAFQSLRVEGLTIKGQIRRVGRDPVHFGHVDYAVLDAGSKVREQGQVEHTAAIRQRQPRQPSRFSIPLQRPLAAGEKVRLAYHVGKHS